MTDPRLAADVDACCRLTGEFTLRSGQVASEYFDKYLFESDPQLLARVVAQMSDLLPEGTELLGGLELGGVPIVTVLSARVWLHRPQQWPLPRRVGIIACQVDDAGYVEQTGLTLAALNAGARIVTTTR